MIVRESIGFERGGANPLKNLRIGQVDAFQEKLEKAGIDRMQIIDYKRSLIIIARNYVSINNGKAFANKSLSEALDRIFDEETAKGKEYKKIINSRRFFKDLIFNTALHEDCLITDYDFMFAWAEYFNKFPNPDFLSKDDPSYFGRILESILGYCQGD